MKILVTGGAGFIGSWVADAYIAEGHEVLVLDNLSSGLRVNVPQNAEFIQGDITDRQVVDNVISGFKPDIVNHHAAQIDVRKSLEDPMFDAGVNIIGSLNLLESCVSRDVGKFIFASTGGAIYGEPENIPADETTPPMPISPYGTSKYSVEKYLQYYKQIHSLDCVALRYANVYGPRQNPHGEAGVIAIFCSRILSSQDCTVFGDGKQTRDYVYSGDVARANVLALSASEGSYNIGTEIETSVNGLIDELKAASGEDFNVKYMDPRPGEVQSISLDVKLAGKVLGWMPETALSEGIKNTWLWFKESNAA
jgi:UDP-glucose 4-epimerase